MINAYAGTHHVVDVFSMIGVYVFGLLLLIIFLRCAIPHLCMAKTTSDNVSLYFVKVYSTVTGFVLQTVRLTSPFTSSSCNSLDNILGLILTSFESSLNFLLPLLKTEIKTNFHFPPTISSVSCMAIRAILHESSS